MPKKKKILIICLASVVALLIFTAAILPFIVRSKAITAIGEETGRKVHIERVSINPFTLTVSVKGFAIEAAGGGPFVSIANLRASLGLASVYKGALIVSGMTVETPAVAFARLAANSYSFNDIIELQKAKPKKPKSEFRFSINNIILKNGSVDFDDQAVEGGRKHTVRDLGIAIPFISNIPYLVEKYTDPYISATVNGAPLKFAGKTKPLSKSMETSVHIDLKKLSLPEYVAYSPFKSPANLTSGALTVNSDLSYRISSDKKPELNIKGVFRLDDIAISLKENRQPLLKLPSLQVNASNLEVFSRRFLFDSIALGGLELFISRDAKGEWIYNRLLFHAAKTGLEKSTGSSADKKASEQDGKQQSLVQVASFKLADGIIHFSDALPAGGSRITADQIDVAIANFSTETGKSADYELSMLLDREATLAADGSFSLNPLNVSLSTELSDFKLQSRWPYLAQWLTSPLKGTVDLACDTTFTKEDGLTVTKGRFLANGLSARYGDKDGFDMTSFEVNGAGYSQKKNALEVAEIRLSKGTVSLSRELDGSMSLLSLMKKKSSAPVPPDGMRNLPAVAAAKAAAASAEPKGKQAPTAFSYQFKKILVDRLTTTFTDKTFEDNPRFTLSNTSLSLSNLNGPRFTPAALRFASTFNKNTPLKASGDITPESLPL